MEGMVVPSLSILSETSQCLQAELAYLLLEAEAEAEPAVTEVEMLPAYGTAQQEDKAETAAKAARYL